MERIEQGLKRVILHNRRPWSPTLLREWAYGRPYRTNDERVTALPLFVDFYNQRRPHTALGGRSPLDAVSNVPGDHS